VYKKVRRVFVGLKLQQVIEKPDPQTVFGEGSVETNYVEGTNSVYRGSKVIEVSSAIA
jgi:hypothetical protein